MKNWIKKTTKNKEKLQKSLNDRKNALISKTKAGAKLLDLQKKKRALKKKIKKKVKEKIFGKKETEKKKTESRVKQTKKQMTPEERVAYNKKRRETRKSQATPKQPLSAEEAAELKEERRLKKNKRQKEYREKQKGLKKEFGELKQSFVDIQIKISQAEFEGEEPLKMYEQFDRIKTQFQEHTMFTTDMISLTEFKNEEYFDYIRQTIEMYEEVNQTVIGLLESKEIPIEYGTQYLKEYLERENMF